jgi:hypothetical protein
MKYTGGCHCGNILVVLESDLAPSEFEVRACQCGFCRKHNTRAIADPAGRAVIEVKDADRLSRYRFGLKTAEYLVCRDCGVYVAAVTPEEIGEVRAIVIVNALDKHTLFSGSCYSRKLRWRGDGGSNCTPPGALDTRNCPRHLKLRLKRNIRHTVDLGLCHQLRS